MHRHLLSILFALAAASGSALADPKWVEATGKSCPEACIDEGLIPVAGGIYTPTKNAYYICAADAEGLRPGYNLTAVPARTCNVGHDSKEKALNNARCLCFSKKVVAN
jgi:hypothetical protein